MKTEKCGDKGFMKVHVKKTNIRLTFLKPRARFPSTFSLIAIELNLRSRSNQTSKVAVKYFTRFVDCRLTGKSRGLNF